MPSARCQLGLRKSTPASCMRSVTSLIASPSFDGGVRHSPTTCQPVLPPRVMPGTKVILMRPSKASAAANCFCHRSTNSCSCRAEMERRAYVRCAGLKRSFSTAARSRMPGSTGLPSDVSQFRGIALSIRYKYWRYYWKANAVLRNSTFRRRNKMNSDCSRRSHRSWFQSRQKDTPRICPRTHRR